MNEAQTTTSKFSWLMNTGRKHLALLLLLAVYMAVTWQHPEDVWVYARIGV